jgi:predicted small lipoprotein YifL
MIRSFMRSTALVVVAVFSLAGCGNAAPNTSEPAGAVGAALDAAESGGFAKIADFTCAANQGKITSAFGGSGDLSSLQALGVPANELLDAVKVDFQDIKATETSKAGDKATVHVTGKAVTSFDPAKMKEVLKKVMAAQGQPADDATINAAMTAMSSQLTQTQALDRDVNLVQEGGKWLICS